MQTYTMLYPDKRVVTGEEIQQRAIDEDVSQGIQAGLYTTDEEIERAIAEYTEMYMHPDSGLENAIMFLEDNGFITLATAHDEWDNHCQ